MFVGCVAVDMDQGNRIIEEVGKRETGDQGNDGFEVVEIPSQTLKCGCEVWFIARPILLFTISLFPGISWRNDAHDFRVCGKLTIHFRFSAHALNPRPDSKCSHFKDQSVSWHHGPAETGFLNASKQNKFLVAVFNLTQGQYRSNLGQRLDHKHPWHHRCSREVSLKEVLVDTNLLNPHDTFARYELNYAIYQQEGITMRQKLLYRQGV